jgi:hypothetical protein
MEGGWKWREEVEMGQGVVVRSENNNMIRQKQ